MSNQTSAPRTKKGRSSHPYISGIYALAQRWYNDGIPGEPDSAGKEIYPVTLPRQIAKAIHPDSPYRALFIAYFFVAGCLACSIPFAAWAQSVALSPLTTALPLVLFVALVCIIRHIIQQKEGSSSTDEFAQTQRKQFNTFLRFLKIYNISYRDLPVLNSYGHEELQRIDSEKSLRTSIGVGFISLVATAVFSIVSAGSNNASALIIAPFISAATFAILSLIPTMLLNDPKDERVLRAFLGMVKRGHLNTLGADRTIEVLYVPVEHHKQNKEATKAPEPQDANETDDNHSEPPEND